MTTAGELRARAEELARRLERLDSDRVALEAARGALGDFKPAAYERALERVANRKRLIAAQAVAAETAGRLRLAEDEARHLNDLLLVVEVHEAAAREDAAAARLAQVRRGLEALGRLPAADRLRRRRAGARLREKRTLLIDDVRHRRAELTSAVEAAQGRGVAHLVGSAIARDDVEAAREDALARARVLAAELVVLDHDADALHGNGLDTFADRDLVERERSRWQEHQRLLRLEEASARQERTRPALLADHAATLALLARHDLAWPEAG